MLYQFIENGNGLPSSITASSGAVSVNSKKIRGEARLIHIEPATSTTAWTLSIIDRNSRVVRKYTAEEGTLNDNEPLPLDGVYTFQFSDVSADEAIKVLLMVKEAER